MFGKWDCCSVTVLEQRNMFSFTKSKLGLWEIWTSGIHVCYKTCIALKKRVFFDLHFSTISQSLESIIGSAENSYNRCSWTKVNEIWVEALISLQALSTQMLAWQVRRLANKNGTKTQWSAVRKFWRGSCKDCWTDHSSEFFVAWNSFSFVLLIFYLVSGFHLWLERYN